MSGCFLLTAVCMCLRHSSSQHHHHPHDKPVALRGGGVSCLGLSLVFEYTVVELG